MKWNRMIEMGLELDLHAYTALIWGFSQFGQMQQAKTWLDEMIGKGILPDEILCVSVLKKYHELGNVIEATELHNEFVKMGLLKGTCDYAVPDA